MALRSPMVVAPRQWWGGGVEGGNLIGGGELAIGTCQGWAKVITIATKS